MRVIDICAGLVGLVLFALAALVLVPLIRFTSPGPAIFAQTRVGRNGKRFVCRKFRSLRMATGDMPTFMLPPTQVTAVGRVLRASKLDELPQLWNVLKGEMSLVGPRPCLPSQTELITERERRGVLAVRPGITGYAQIQNIDMSDPVRLARADAAYVADRSLTGDLAILAATLMPVPALRRFAVRKAVTGPDRR
jgi:O-antigen biosynthesis protein WbqP